jgi:hypothetical protein
MESSRLVLTLACEIEKSYGDPWRHPRFSLEGRGEQRPGRDRPVEFSAQALFGGSPFTWDGSFDDKNQ